MPRSLTALDFGHYTITDTAGTLFSFAESGSPSEMPAGAHCFKGRLETANIRARWDDTDPTTTVGELIESGDDLLLDVGLLRNMKFVRATGTSGKLVGHFWQAEAHYFLGGG
jgi:hypothetical protein|tara:strand:- start:3378 stop:3713 length:336 start_codon:yes stop_codon:yes gene_type:complete